MELLYCILTLFLLILIARVIYQLSVKQQIPPRCPVQKSFASPSLNSIQKENKPVIQADTSHSSIKNTHQEGFSLYIPTGLHYSFAGGDANYFPRIITEKPVEPDQVEIVQKYRDCIASQTDTVKGCLTSSGAGFRPTICMKLCAEQYGDMSKYCTSVCIDQQNQVNTSARFGPA
jgi:hypothetical protein